MATEVTVPASDPWFNTGVAVVPGQRLRIEVPPGQTWVDWFLTYGPEGGTSWAQAPFRPLLRVKTDDDGRRAEFFTLVAAIVTADAPHVLAQRIVVGAGPREFTARHAGRLVCFANDVPFAYGNNKGAMRIRVA